MRIMKCKHLLSALLFTLIFLFADATLSIPLKSSLPSSTDSCPFNTGFCSTEHSGFYWSGDSPPGPVPSYDGSPYIWTDQNGAYYVTDYLDNVNSATIVSLYYYLTAVYGEIQVSFVPETTGYPVLLQTLPYVATTWLYETVQCGSTCCGIGTTYCNGQFRIDVVGSTGFIAAIDDLGSSNFGENSCCEFDDESICGFTSTSGPYGGWSYIETSIYTVPYPSSPYVYFHITSAPTAIYQTTLSSKLVTINNNAEFQATVYAYTEAPDNYLSIGFRNPISSTLILATVITTAEAWTILSFQCNPITLDCCAGAASCNGYIEVVANILDYGSTATYAVDSIGLAGQC